MKADFPSRADFEAAARLLKCDVAAVQAVAQVEAGPYGAFLQEEEGEPPVVLFERHYFDRLTKGRYRGARAPGVPARCANISLPKGGGYGPVSAQHKRLQAAVKLDRGAALRSASWGLYQLMGVNHAACGYPELQRFITAMYRSVEDHLRAFTMFIRHDARLVDAIRARDWLAFALIYNGPKQQGYDKKLRAAYADLAGTTEPQ